MIGEAAPAMILLVKETKAWKLWLELLEASKRLETCDTFKIDGVNAHKYSADCKELWIKTKRTLNGLSLPLQTHDQWISLGDAEIINGMEDKVN